MRVNVRARTRGRGRMNSYTILQRERKRKLKLKLELTGRRERRGSVEEGGKREATARRIARDDDIFRAVDLHELGVGLRPSVELRRGNIARGEPVLAQEHHLSRLLAQHLREQPYEIFRLGDGKGRTVSPEDHTRPRLPRCHVRGQRVAVGVLGVRWCGQGRKLGRVDPRAAEVVVVVHLTVLLANDPAGGLPGRVGRDAVCVEADAERCEEGDRGHQISQRFKP
mmetsp:Transcript_69965/g.195699  ORF Transcript_69965/g.195699 Transcript_69965/m.195699 type:complete len:225 (-) Transcript_69965:704-1378(-)